MPNCTVHRLGAVPAGAALAFDCARTQAPAARFWETLGGGLGGDLGGRLPDIWNPPTHPNHRGWAHGILPAVTTAMVIQPKLVSVQEWLRIQSERFSEQARQHPDLAGQIWFALLDILCRILAGVTVGLPGGYASHLVLDACTPAMLPIIC